MLGHKQHSLPRIHSRVSYLSTPEGKKLQHKEPSVSKQSASKRSKTTFSRLLPARSLHAHSQPERGRDPVRHRRLFRLVSRLEVKSQVEAPKPHKRQRHAPHPGSTSAVWRSPAELSRAERLRADFQHQYRHVRGSAATASGGGVFQNKTHCLQTRLKNILTNKFICFHRGVLNIYRLKCVFIALNSQKWKPDF